MTLKHVHIVRSGGREYRYLRHPSLPRVPLPNDVPLDSPEFLRAYSEALRQPELAIAASRHAPGTIGALIAAAVSSERWHALSDGYRRTLRRHLDAIRERAAGARYADLRGRHIRADIAGLSAGQARDRLKAWRFALGFAVEAGLLEADPSIGLRPPQREAGEHPAWTADEIAAFRAHWPIGAAQRTAFELLYWTGARISDAVRLGPLMLDRDGVLTFRQQKTGDTAYVPWTCPLPAYAKDMVTDRRMCLAAMPTGVMLWLVTQAGAPRTSRGLGNLVRDAAREAGIEGKSAHGLRKARAVALAEAGATPHQIAAWTGHRTLKEVTRYTGESDRRKAVMGNASGTDFVKPARKL